MGNLVTVTEPDPAGGADWTTSYTYNFLNQLTLEFARLIWPTLIV
jgi:hypothetical protein